MYVSFILTLPIVGGFLFVGARKLNAVTLYVQFGSRQWRYFSAYEHCRRYLELSNKCSSEIMEARQKKVFLVYVCFVDVGNCIRK